MYSSLYLSSRQEVQRRVHRPLGPCCQAFLVPRTANNVFGPEIQCHHSEALAENIKAGMSAHLLAVVEHHGLGHIVDGQAQSCPPGNDNGENSGPDGEQRDDDEEGCGDGPHYVGPHSRAVQDAHERGQALHNEGAVLPGQHNLEVTLRSSHRLVISYALHMQIHVTVSSVRLQAAMTEVHAMQMGLPQVKAVLFEP